MIKGIEIFESPLFGVACFLLLASVWFWLKKREKPSLLFLFAGALFLRFWAIELDPFLHDWDERWHAVVAKNFIVDPLVPRIRLDPALPYYTNTWCCSYYWLHKPPIFMWLMALSMKLFGVGTFALRLPSAVLGALQCLIIYRTGKLVFSKDIGFLSAFFFALSYFQLELTSGNMGLDHRDVAMCFFVTASFWALAEYQVSKSRKWLLLIGIFAGLAVLVMWYVGLLVFAGWAFSILVDFVKNKKITGRELIAPSIAFMTAIAVALPWQIYTAIKWPVEYKFEQSYNWRHISEPLEGFSGGIDYYFNNLPVYFFPYASIMLACGLILMLFRATNKFMSVVIFSSIVGVWVFFSFVPATKALWYIFIVGGISIFAFGVFFQTIIDLITGRKKNLSPYLFGLTIISAGLLFLSTAKLSDQHHDPRRNKEGQMKRKQKRDRTAIYQKLDSILPENTYIVLVPEFCETEIMFWSNMHAYGWANDKQIYQLLNEGKKVAVFRNNQSEAWFRGHPEVIKIDYDH